MRVMSTFDTTVHARITQNYYEHEKSQALEPYQERIQAFLTNRSGSDISDAELRAVEMADTVATIDAGKSVQMTLTPMFSANGTSQAMIKISRGYRGHQLDSTKIAELAQAMQSAGQGILSYYGSDIAHATAFRVRDGHVQHFDPNIGELAYPLASLPDILEASKGFGYSGLHSVQLMRAQPK